MLLIVEKKMRKELFIGMLIGTLVTFMLYSLSLLQKPSTVYSTYRSTVDRYGHGSVEKQELQHNHSHELQNSSIVNNTTNFQPIEFKDEHIHHDDDTIAKDLYANVRVLCWVMTSPANLDTKTIHVKNTWGKRCNKMLYISSVTNDTFPTIGLNVPEGRQHLTAKSRQAFQYIYDHHFDDADWFMKCDDDTYVIVENLRYFLSSENTNEPIYFGHHFNIIVKQGYFSGGAGYVLSKEALRRYGTNKIVPCQKDGGAEDVVIGKCMQNLGVKAGNSTDSFGRSRFHCFTSQTHLMGGYPNWYYKYDARGGRKGQKSLSDYAISFHYVSPALMYNMEYFIYHLRPYGIVNGLQDLNQRKTISNSTV